VILIKENKMKARQKCLNAWEIHLLDVPYDDEDHEIITNLRTCNKCGYKVSKEEYEPSLGHCLECHGG
tara:strand:+ start:206 stop:409 length:204 start_codon:yes stop_codon:yes gene_type:complete